MLVLEIISVNGMAPEPPVQAAMEAGDSAGRGPGNALVLPDPERRVSRVHAQFALRRGVARIIGRGSAPLRVDGQPLDMGEEVDLANGARIEIGSYVLRVHLRSRPPDAA